MNKLTSLAEFIGRRNYVTFREIEESLEIAKDEAIALKGDLETHMGVDISSLMILDPPGFFIEDGHRSRTNSSFALSKVPLGPARLASIASRHKFATTESAACSSST